MDEHQEKKCGNKDFNNGVNISHKCESCGKSFSHVLTLKTHIHKVHEGHKDYKCDLCGKSFSQAGSLKIHLNTIHKGHRNHKCDSCGK